MYILFLYCSFVCFFFTRTNNKSKEIERETKNKGIIMKRQNAHNVNQAKEQTDRKQKCIEKYMLFVDFERKTIG